MKSSKLLTAIITIAGMGLATLALAQDNSSQDSHHPAQEGETQPDVSAPQLPVQPDQPGMMGMMRMMDMAQMMRMMNMMGGGNAAPGGMGMEGMGFAGMTMIGHVEGRIAFLRAELKITDPQAGAWDAFANALRDNAKRLDEARKAIHSDAGAQTLEQRLAAQEQWLSARLEGIRAIKPALGGLYQVLSPDQRKSAEELLWMHIGLMPGGMKPIGMMQMGTPGQ
jgi:LTXXQ motif family protein